MPETQVINDVVLDLLRKRILQEGLTASLDQELLKELQEQFPCDNTECETGQVVVEDIGFHQSKYGTCDRCSGSSMNQQGRNLYQAKTLEQVKQYIKPVSPV